MTRSSEYQLPYQNRQLLKHCTDQMHLAQYHMTYRNNGVAF